MRWTRVARADECAIGGRRSRVVLMPRRWRQILEKLTLLRDDGDNKARSPGRSRRKPLKPLRREGRVQPANLWWTNSYAFHFRIRGCGCIGHPAFPAPSILRVAHPCARLGRPRAARSVDSCLTALTICCMVGNSFVAAGDVARLSQRAVIASLNRQRPIRVGYRIGAVMEVSSESVRRAHGK
jgi:hypothetical protein